MGYVPEGAKWYLADIVQEITIEDDSRNHVHTILVLVRADSAEEAYQRALEIGAREEQQRSFKDLQGRGVSSRFRGLRDLNVIHDQLDHGAALRYTVEDGMDEDAIQQWVTPKERL